MKKLFVIPARGGSKGLLRKNILPLFGKPMIEYTLDAATGAMTEGDELCVSTDDSEIARVVEDYGVKIPFKRPAELASDTAGSEEVVKHAIEWYTKQGQDFDVIVLLQVTSPLRNAQHLKEALALWSPEIDLVVSVKETGSNPYYVLFEEDESGFLHKSKKGEFARRQDCPKVYEYNGAIYVINATRFHECGFRGLTRRRKYLMNKRTSLDVDDAIDFELAGLLLKDSNLL